MEKCSDPSEVLRYDSDICQTCDDYFYANDELTECIQDTCGNPILEILSKDGKCTVISSDTELAQLFDNEKALSNLEKFTSRNGAHHYTLDINKEKIKLFKSTEKTLFKKYLNVGKNKIRIFDPGFPIFWRV